MISEALVSGIHARTHNKKVQRTSALKTWVDTLSRCGIKNTAVGHKVRFVAQHLSRVAQAPERQQVVAINIPHHDMAAVVGRNNKVPC